ncbi:WLM-domain-containing protein [Cylindrobasidium torrendii FP15055 ss-10]|uniref:WLM-domain-containing protein n=1 Tax=Cylindrobasidium torrendii FP15055 ss-10 TaxID=1314674 RepID=A0A0D7BRZ1_9AGAR|nr:WLM-domain-containing protein [Cylindrobasidium torrendii FP15055 ss-10]
MVHLRINARESNPNPHINFITVLPDEDDAENDARQLLRALAAQVRPVMKAHGFVINSFEEYAHNSVFLGRNWNNGETVELVLRRPGGSFMPTYSLLSTLCHELAHIAHMNHGPDFQALWSQLRVEVRQLQNKGYYGDGYWSSGTRLSDSNTMPGDGEMQPGDLPEYICGGAQRRTRPSVKRRRKRRNPYETAPSNSTGRQSAKKRKAGARNTSKNAFQGEGVALDEDSNSKSGKGFGKQAGSKRAREERALAAERRMKALGQPQPGPSNTGSSQPDDEEVDDESESEVEIVEETDADRKKALAQAKAQVDTDDVKPSWFDFRDDFVFTNSNGGGGGAGTSNDVIDISSDEEGTRITMSGKPKHSTLQPHLRATGLGSIVKDEIGFRKKEALGMQTGAAHKLGGGKSASSPTLSTAVRTDSWECGVCTLRNKQSAMACDACDNLRPDIQHTLQ